MGKRVVYTKIMPLPANIPRQLALDMLHSHGEVIQLNPLVTDHQPISAPRDAPADEYFAQWYEITEIITWGFGMKKKISFKGVFHDMPWGLQTHTYAPMGVDLRIKYQVRGNQPGEPREARELGVDTPADGLYLRSDVEITCNIAFAGFVKKEMKAANVTMFERLTRKAELLDDGVLHAMFEKGRLKTINPTQRGGGESLLKTPSTNPSTSPAVSDSPNSPPASHGEFPPEKTYTSYYDLPGRMTSQRASYLRPHELDHRPQSGYSQGSGSPFVTAVEVEGSNYFTQPDSRASHQGPQGQVFRSELADTSLPQDQKHPSRQSNTYHQRQSSSQSRLSPPSSPNLGQQTNSPSNRYGANSNPMPAPLRPGRQSIIGSNYAITNPDDGVRAHRPVSSIDASQQPSQTNPGTQLDQGLANQVRGLGLSDVAPTDPASSGITKCPICGLFEGDSSAVSHHVNRTHFG